MMRHTLPTRSLRAVLAVLCCLGTLLLVSNWGCTDGVPTRDTRSVALNLSIVFEEIPGAPAGVVPAAQVRIGLIRARALELAGATETLRDSAEAVIAESDSTFRLALSVPPAPLYRVDVEALSPGGLALYSGSSLIENVGGGESRPVEIVLRDVRIPATPTLLAATALSDSSIALSWQDNADNESQYEVERKGAGPSRPWIQIALLPGSFQGLLDYLDSPLPDRTTYTYRVRARGEAGPSQFSNEATATTGVPSPFIVSAVETTPLAVTITWTFPGTDPQGFSLWREIEGSEAPAVEIARPGGADRSHLDQGLSPRTTYRYSMFAFEGTDNSPVSNTRSVRTTDDPPVCQVLPESIAFGEVLLGSFVDREVVITNVGGGTLTGEVGIADCAGFSILSGGGSYALARNETRVVTVRFEPELLETGDCTLTTGTNCPEVTLSGTGAGVADCVLSVEALDFGTVAPAGESNRSFTVTSTGTAPLTFDPGNIAVLGCPDFTITNAPGAVELLPGNSVEVFVSFSPDAPGPVTCLLDVEPCGSITLTGRGEALPLCEVSAASLDFGTLLPDAVATRAVTLKNVGGGVVSGIVQLSCEGDAFSITSGGGSFSLAAGESMVVDLAFSASADGLYNCTLDTGTDCGAVTLAAAVERLPLCAVEPTTLDFGTVDLGQSADRSFTITNVGGGTLAGSVSASCAGYSIVSGGGAYALEAGASVEVTVRFSPTAAGIAPCIIDTGNSCDDVSATGAGEALPVCSVTPEVLSFGSVTIGESAELDVTITNTGGGILSGTVSEPDCAEFAILEGGGDYALAAGASRVVTVAFVPESTGLALCTLSTGADCADVDLSGQGVGFTACTVEPEILDFGVLILEDGAPNFIEKTFTLTNTGTLPISGSFSESCAQFSLVSGAGSYNLLPGEFRTVTVRFAPSVLGQHECVINTGTNCNPVTALGEATIPPNCAIEGAQNVVFGVLGVEKILDGTFTIRNTGGSVLTGNVTLGDCNPDDFSIVSGGGAYALGAGQTHTVTVRFQPGSAGFKSCEILTGTPLCPSVDATGTAIFCEVSPQFIDFGVVDLIPQKPGDPEASPSATAATRTFTITNVAAVPYNGNLSAACTYYSVSPSGSFFINPGASIQVEVTFEPLDTGRYDCTIQVGPDCDPVEVTGVGGIPPLCDQVIFYGEGQDPIVEPVYFFACTGSDGVTLRIYNDGGSNLVLQVPQPCGNGVFTFEFSPPATGSTVVVPPGNFATLLVTASSPSCEYAECTLTLNPTFCTPITLINETLGAKPDPDR